MAAINGSTVLIQDHIERLRAGDASARQALIDCACRRLEALTRKMLGGWPRVHRWEQTDDVLQNALLRLYRALADAPPADARAFFRLAALSIRRELFDLAKRYYGPCGLGANHATAFWRSPDEGESPEALDSSPDSEADDPSRLAAWAEFHAQVERLPDEDREVFDLIWHQELSQAEVASLLGVSERTVKRRWASARLCLQKVLGKTLASCEGPISAEAQRADNL